MFIPIYNLINELLFNLLYYIIYLYNLNIVIKVAILSKLYQECMISIFEQ